MLLWLIALGLLLLLWYTINKLPQPPKDTNMAISAALSANERNSQVQGALRTVFANVTMGQNYVTNGIPITPALFGLQEIVWIAAAGPALTGTSVYQWDQTNLKLKSFVSSTGAETANAFNCTADVLPVIVFGR
jgi:predicted permease